MASEYETVRTRILSGEPPRRPTEITPLTSTNINPPASSPTPSNDINITTTTTTPTTIPPPPPPLPNTFISTLAAHVKSLSEARISHGFLHLHPSPIHSSPRITPYLPTPSAQYTHLTDLFRRIDVNLFTVTPSRLQSFLSSILSRSIHHSTYLSATATDLPTTAKICTSIFTSSGTITELNLPNTPGYTSELSTLESQGHAAARFSTVLKARERVFNHANALCYLITALIAPGGELSQDVIQQTHRILVRDCEPVDSKSWQQYGGWYRDYRLLTESEAAAASVISSESVRSGMGSPLAGGSWNSGVVGSRRSSSIYTLQPGEVPRRSSSVYTYNYTFPPISGESRRRGSGSNSIAPSSSGISPTDPRRSSIISHYPITPITELYEDEAELDLQPPKVSEEDEGIKPRDGRNRRESIDPRAVAMYMSKLISTYHAQLAMDRGQMTREPQVCEEQEEDEEKEEEATVSDPFALSAWLVTEFLHINPFVVANEEMSRIILAGVLMKELGIVAVLGEERDKAEGRDEYLGIMERCGERHREEGQQGHGESYAEFAALVVRKAVECVEELAAVVGRS